MSTNPTTQISERRRFIAERAAQLRTELAALTAEGDELDIAERVLKRFSEAPAIGGRAGHQPVNGNGAEHDPEDGLTLPQMAFAILEEARAAGRKGVDGAEILRTIKSRWKPEFTADKVRPTLWRMCKHRRLRKRGKLYSLPDSSTEVETEAVGASVHH